MKVEYSVCNSILFMGLVPKGIKKIINILPNRLLNCSLPKKMRLNSLMDLMYF